MNSKKNILNQIWTENAPHEPGLFTVRQVATSPTGQPILFAGLKSEADSPPIRIFLLSIPINLAKKYSLNKKLNNLTIAPLENSNDKTRAWVSLSLINQEYNSIFEILCSDLIDKVSIATNDNYRIETFLKRINVWVSLFSPDAPKGLSKEAQRGLFGELSCILALASNSNSLKLIISAWTGLMGGHQDFRFPNGSIEVKTSSGNGDFIRIENEYQLDCSQLSSLFLIHVLVNEGPASGKSLTEIVDEIRILSKDTPEVLVAFNNTLIRSGYLDLHSPLYENTRYSIRTLQPYQIRHDFPLINPSRIPVGISDVTYKVEVSKIQKFTFTIDNLKIQLLK